MGQACGWGRGPYLWARISELVISSAAFLTIPVKDPSSVPGQHCFHRTSMTPALGLSLGRQQGLPGGVKGTGTPPRL